MPIRALSALEVRPIQR